MAALRRFSRRCSPRPARRAIHVTRGYEPWEPELEKAVARACEAAGAAFRVFGGRLLFEPEAIVTGDGKPYRVFTPFWKACLAAAAPRTPAASAEALALR